MSATWLALLHAISIGALLSIQAGINIMLGRWISSPIGAAFISFFIGACALAAYIAVTRSSFPQLSNVLAAPPWMWLTGGILGAAIVSSTIFLAPKVGATTLFAAIVFGQLTASLIIDQQGWLGFPQHDISPGRVAGVLLILGGVFLIKKF